MPPELAEGLSTTFSSGRYYEFNPAGVDKGFGLRALADYLGIDIADTIACGDSANDMAMLEAAGVGVVVSNASHDAAAIADYRAKSSCNDGIFAEVLEKFIEPQHRGGGGGGGGARGARHAPGGYAPFANVWCSLHTLHVPFTCR